MGVEVDNLREDVTRMDDQLHREVRVENCLAQQKKHRLHWYPLVMKSFSVGGHFGPQK